MINDSADIRQDVLFIHAGYTAKTELTDDPQQFAGMPPLSEQESFHPDSPGNLVSGEAAF